MACTGFVAESTDNASWNAIEFAAYQACGGGEFIGDRFATGMQFITVRIMLSAVITQRFHTGDADAEVDQTFSPGAAEAIGNDDRNLETGALFDFTMECGCRAIAIFGKQHGMLAAIYIRHVDAAVGAKESVVCFSDQYSVLAANHSAALTQRQFHDTRIVAELPCPRQRFVRRSDGRQINYPAFGFGDDLMFDDENVAGEKALTVAAKRLDQFIGDGIAWLDVGSKLDGN